MQAARVELQAALAHDAAGRRSEAAAAFARLLTYVPDHPGAHLRLAQYARADGSPQLAREHLLRAAAGSRTMNVGADAAPIFAELSTVERQRGDGLAALAAARDGLQRCGEIAGLIWEECESLGMLGDTPQRLHRLNRLALLQPDDPVILVELGLALVDSSSALQAIIPLRRALLLGHRDTRVSLTLATLELHAGHLADATERLEALLATAADTEQLGVLGLLWFARRQQCQWTVAETLEARWMRLTESGAVHSALTPFMLLASQISPDRLRDYVARYNARYGARPPAISLTSPTLSEVTQVTPSSPRRLRVGYLSADFHAHATAILAAGLFEQHAHDRFELFAYSYGPRVDDEYRTRLKAAIRHWRDINDQSDAAAAQLIAADGLDVLVEMKGLTYGARPGIVALRPAPHILHYLGYPGTLCSEGIDYLVADTVVVPPTDAALYAETVLRLPRCYQINDHRRAHPPVPSRATLGLSDDMIVLCNFNQAFKWSAAYFDVWFAALREQPRAVLWLLDPGPDAQQAVMQVAQRAGVASRIVWAPRLPADLHLARLGAANLALDQLPVASHTTAADALWMGVPVLTTLGHAFHGRVAASLLGAAELGSFVATDLAGYAARLRQLLAEPAQLVAAQLHLRERRLALPLFATKDFVRDWEGLLEDLCCVRRQAPE